MLRLLLSFMYVHTVEPGRTAMAPSNIGAALALLQVCSHCDQCKAYPCSFSTAPARFGNDPGTSECQPKANDLHTQNTKTR